MLGLTQSRSGTLSDIDGFVQLIRSTYKSVEPINITGKDQTHLKCDCVNGSIVNGIPAPILFSSALDKPASHKTHSFIKMHKLISFIKQLLKSRIKSDFNGETISFTCQLIKL